MSSKWRGRGHGGRSGLHGDGERGREGGGRGGQRGGGWGGDRRGSGGGAGYEARGGYQVAGGGYRGDQTGIRGGTDRGGQGGAPVRGDRGGHGGAHARGDRGGHGGAPARGDRGHGGAPARGDRGGHGGAPARGDYGGHRGAPARGDYGGHRGAPARGDYGGHRGAPARGDYGGHGGAPARGDRGRGGYGRGNRGRDGGGAPSYENPDTLFNPLDAPAIVDTSLEAKADAIVAQLVNTNSWEEGQLPPRPGFGQAGVLTTVRANFFKVDLPKHPIYQYDVDFSPNESSLKRRERLFQLMQDDPKFKTLVKDSTTIAHDSSNTIISAKKLDVRENTKYEFRIRFYSEVDGPSDRDKNYEVQISLIREFNSEELVDYIHGKARNYDPEPIIRALNIILAKFPTSEANFKDKRIVNPRRKQNQFFIVDKESRDLGGALVAYRGYYSSVRPSLGTVLCNINVCMAAFFKPMNLGVMINDGRENVEEGIAGDGLKVTTDYMGTRKEMVISGIGDRNPEEQKFFWDEENKEVSVKYFFKKSEFNFPGWNAFSHGRNTAYIPAECCTIVDGQIFSSRLNSDQTSAMLRVACRPPKQNAELIIGEGMAILGLKPNSPNHTLKSFGLKVSEHMEAINSRVLPPPTVQYSSSNIEIKPKTAGWNLRGVKFPHGGVLKNWAVMVIQDGGASDYSNQNSVKGIMAELVKMCRTSGVFVNDAEPRIIKFCELSRRYGDRLRYAAAEKMSQVLAEIVASPPKTGILQKPNFLLVLLSSEDKNVYNHLKFLVDCKFGIPTVCCQSEKIRETRGRMQYLGNVAMKVNLKTGGRNHGLSGNALHYLGTDSIILGADVTHPSQGSEEYTPSIAAVVGSYENTYSLYPGSLRLQESRLEMIEHLDDQVAERLKQYRAKNPSKILPQKIIYFRDGVSEGEFKRVNTFELPLIKAACANASNNDPTYKPRIAIIICGKRHHTRFYPTDPDFTDGKGNCAPGTVVDRGITSVHGHDFYLQAHVGLQGTARSAHYTVIYDELGFSADSLQTLVHNLSYLFMRATKAVSYVPPAYYADILCDRGRCYLQGLLSGEVRVSLPDGRGNTRVGRGRGGGGVGEDASPADKEAKRKAKEQAVMEEAKKMWGGGPREEITGLMFYL
ncbi:hypothetical protein BDZ91DRAFT_801275 [Kalaharituber pfeilii]|nr:hypothetical protein BDZ91DRAFT_801275 [Kalaharituber pfeilii]